MNRTSANNSGATTTASIVVIPASSCFVAILGAFMTSAALLYLFRVQMNLEMRIELEESRSTYDPPAVTNRQAEA